MHPIIFGCITWPYTTYIESYILKDISKPTHMLANLEEPPIIQFILEENYKYKTFNLDFPSGMTCKKVVHTKLLSFLLSLLIYF